MIGVYRMAQAEGVGQKSGAEKNRLVVECEKSPNPRSILTAEKPGDSESPLPKATCDQSGHGFGFFKDRRDMVRPVKISI